MIPGKQFTPEILIHLGWRRKWLIAIPTVVIATAVAAYTHYLPNVYQSDALILVVPQQVPDNYVHSAVTVRIEDRLQSINQQILSRTRLERIIQDFNLYADLRKTEIMEDIVERMRKDISVETVKGDAFRVSFSADDPRAAMRVTERLASFFIDESLKDRELLAESTNQFLEAQLEDARSRLIENEKKLQEYRRQHDGELPTQVDANMQGLHGTEMQVQALIDSMNRDRDSRLVVERMIANASASDGSASPGGPGGNDAPAGGPAAAQLRQAEADLRALELKLKPEHPDVINQKRRVAELQKLADAELAGQPVSDQPAAAPPSEIARRNRLQDAKATLDKLDQQLASKTAEEQRLRGIMKEYQKRIEAAPGRETELIELMRDYGTIQQSYSSLLSKKEESQIAANLERRQIGEQFKILDPARLPERPSSPNRPRLYLLGAISALAFGFACAAGAEYFDRSMRSEEDVRMALNLPVLATIPLLRSQKAPTGYFRAALAASLGGAAIVGAAAIVWRLLK